MGTMENTSKNFFHVAGVLFTIAMLALTAILAIRLYLTEGGWAGTLGLAAGLAATAIFAVGINTWVDSWSTDGASKVLCGISVFGAIPLLIGLYGLLFAPSVFTGICLNIGAIVFSAPVFIAALWGFGLYMRYHTRLFAN